MCSVVCVVHVERLEVVFNSGQVFVGEVDVLRTWGAIKFASATKNGIGWDESPKERMFVVSLGVANKGFPVLVPQPLAHTKEMPDTCVDWTEAQFRIWSGQEEIIEEKKTEEIDLDSMEDSLLECPQCHSRKVDHFGKQTRSADEPETIFAHCLACGHRWRQ